MAQLVIVVMSVMLAAIVVAGGINYLHGDIGVRTDVAQRVGTMASVLETAFRSYRIANRGALPTPGEVRGAGDPDQAWQAELSSYLPGSIDAPNGMMWDYLDNGEAGVSRILCLHGSGISKAQYAGLSSASDRLPDTTLTKNCLDTEAVDTFDGSAALVVPLRIAN